MLWVWYTFQTFVTVFIVWWIAGFLFVGDESCGTATAVRRRQAAVRAKPAAAAAAAARTTRVSSTATASRPRRVGLGAAAGRAETVISRGVFLTTEAMRKRGMWLTASAYANQYARFGFERLVSPSSSSSSLNYDTFRWDVYKTQWPNIYRIVNDANRLAIQYCGGEVVACLVRPGALDIERSGSADNDSLFRAQPTGSTSDYKHPRVLLSISKNNDKVRYYLRSMAEQATEKASYVPVGLLGEYVEWFAPTEDDNAKWVWTTEVPPAGINQVPFDPAQE